MLQNFQKHQSTDRYEGDICIIGAGAAGITVARQFLGTSQKVILVESGGADYEDDTQALAKGVSSGFSYYDLAESRLRFFGGTTAIWGGRVAQLDDIDFEKRDWVKHSGWPFPKDVLRPYYVMAQHSLGLPPVADNGCPEFQTDLDEDILSPAFWQFDKMADRFTLRRCQDLVKASNIHILLGANVTDMSAHHDGHYLDAVSIKSLSGHAAQIKAKAFVLAVGGLEVPRLLLNARSDAHPDGLGNNHDQVGRYFMEHPHARAARVHVKCPQTLFSALPRFQRWKGQRYGMLFRPGDVYQRHIRILNTGFTLAVRKHPGEEQLAYKQAYNKLRHDLNPTRLGRFFWKMTRRTATAIQDRKGMAMNVKTLMKKSDEYGLYAVMRAEQAPNPDSRVSLSDSFDVLGMQQINLDWQFSEIDKLSVSRAMEALDQEFQRLGYGYVEKQDWLTDPRKAWEVDPLVSNHPIGGYHHMGTARMAENPKTGVVDADCCVHGVNNLYVAGSAVFPTSGWANPTLTIIALSLRLADKLKTEFI